jgi:hypothetical protein
MCRILDFINKPSQRPGIFRDNPGLIDNLHPHTLRGVMK